MFIELEERKGKCKNENQTIILIVFGFMERRFFFFVDIRFKEIFIKLRTDDILYVIYCIYYIIKLLIEKFLSRVVLLIFNGC